MVSPMKHDLLSSQVLPFFDKHVISKFRLLCAHRFVTDAPRAKLVLAQLEEQ